MQNSILRSTSITGAITFAAALAAAACSGSPGGTPVKDNADSVAVVPMSKPAANAEVAERTADSAQAVGVPAAVAAVGTHGEDLYDQVKAASWSNAKVILDSLDGSVNALKPAEKAQLTGVIDTLHKAIAAREQAVAIVAANRVTFVGAALTEAYHPKMPAEIVRLDYYGRELEIWAARHDMARLRTTAAALGNSWNAIRASEISHGGTAAAARTDSLVARLRSASTASEYARLATPILDVVDQLEKPFEK